MLQTANLQQLLISARLYYREVYMLIPRQKLCTEVDEKGNSVPVVKYFVYDNVDCAFVVNRTFSCYNTKEECQEAIDFYEGFKIASVS